MEFQKVVSELEDIDKESFGFHDDSIGFEERMNLILSNYLKEIRKLRSRFPENRIYKGHVGGVRKFVIFFKQRILISCSSDRKLVVWDFDSGKILNILHFHQGFVFDIIKFDDNHFITCSRDHYVLVWHIGEVDGRYFFDLKHFHKHGNSVQCLLKVSNEEFVFGDDEGSLFFCNFEKEEIVGSLEGTGLSTIECFCPLKKNPKLFCFAGENENNSIIVVHSGTRSILTHLKDRTYGHEGSIQCLCCVHLEDIQKEYVLSGGNDRRINIWDIDEGNVKKTLKVSYSISSLSLFNINPSSSSSKKKEPKTKTTEGKKKKKMNNDPFVLFGDKQGGLGVIKVKKTRQFNVADNNFEIIWREKVHEDKIYCIQPIHLKEGMEHIILSSKDGTISFRLVKLLDIKRTQRERKVKKQIVEKTERTPAMEALFFKVKLRNKVIESYRSVLI